MPKILVVDDEDNIIELIKYNLEREGFQVIYAQDGKAAFNKINFEKPDLIILDLMLPEINGLEVCRILRQEKLTENIPIIMLTAKTEEIDKILGLEMGADDYMTKPFSIRELIARIKVRLRRKFDVTEAIPEIKMEEIIIDDIIMKPNKFEVIIHGAKKNLTLKEFELLKLLMSNPGKVFTRDYLLDRIWELECSYDTRTVDVHIRHLRQKIETDPANPQYILTIRGMGYKFLEN